MSKYYPYVQEQKKIENFVCNRCKKKCLKGSKIEWRHTWLDWQDFREIENICSDCLSHFPKW